NGTATEISDWDFVVFGSVAVLAALRDQPELARDNVDLLVVSGDGTLSDPWKEKSGSLTHWHWNRISDAEASYKGTKWVPDAEALEQGIDTIGDLESRSLHAIRIDITRRETNGGQG